ncbi:MAG: hypothetical protein WCF77_04730, partial [Minisyncoccia bacterium]
KGMDTRYHEKTYAHEKLIIAGASIEHMSMRLPINSGTHPKLTSEQLEKRREEKRHFNAMLDTPDPLRTAWPVSRARSEIRRIILANAWRYVDRTGHPIPPKFFTVTLAENVPDLKTDNERINRLIKAMNRRFGNVIGGGLLKYVYAVEFQKRGAVHYHFVLFNFPFMDRVFSRIREEVKIDRFDLRAISKTDDVERVIRYITKYITKQANDGRFWGQKRYSPSRELKKYIILNDPLAIWDILAWAEPYKKDFRVIETDYIGNINFTQYYLGDKASFNPKVFAEYTRHALELAEKGEQITPPEERNP